MTMNTPQTTNGPTTTKTPTGLPVVASEEERIQEAYLRMAREVRYRPAASPLFDTEAV